MYFMLYFVQIMLRRVVFSFFGRYILTMQEQLTTLSQNLELLSEISGVSFWWHFANRDLLKHVLEKQCSSCWDFCVRIKEAPFAQLSGCQKDHHDTAWKKVLLKRAPVLMECHAGLRFLAVPVFAGEELIGLLYAGPAVCGGNRYPELASEFSQLPRKSEKELLALGKYMETLLSGSIFAPFAEPHSAVLVPNLTSRDKRILSAAHLMRKFSRRKVSVLEIARAVGLSESAFLHNFKRETGFSFSDWLQRLRVSDALRLVEGTDLPFQEISELCGFSDQSRMTLLFHRYLSVSPGKVRAGNSKTAKS